MSTAKFIEGGKAENHNWTEFSHIDNDKTAAIIQNIIEKGKVPRIRLKVPQWAFYHTDKDNPGDFKDTEGCIFVDINTVDIYEYKEQGKRFFGFSSLRADSYARKITGPSTNVLFRVEQSYNVDRTPYLNVTLLHPDEENEEGA